MTHFMGGGSDGYLYTLRCADGSYYVGTTWGDLPRRVSEYQAGILMAIPRLADPRFLAFHQYFEPTDDTIAAERQVKGWRRKKEALIRDDYATPLGLSRRGGGSGASFETRPAAAPRDEDN